MALPPDVHALVGVYVLGAADDAERAAFEAHLAECGDCRAEVRELRETLVALAERAAVPPPEDLRRTLMARVLLSGQQPAGRDLPVPAPRPSRRPSFARARSGAAAWAVAGALAVLSAGATSVAVVQHRQAQEARHLADVVADPAALRVAGQARGGGTVLVALTADRAAVVTSQLPGLSAGRVYQLWVERPGVVQSLGLGPAGQDAAGSWSRMVTGVRAGDLVAVSVEPAGGSARPSTTPIVVLRT